MNHHTEKDFLPWKKKKKEKREITITDNNNKDFLSGFVKGHSAVKSIYTVTSISCKEHRTKPTPIFTPLASKISMETFFSPPLLFKLPRSSKNAKRTKPALETTFTLHAWHLCFQLTWESPPWHISWQLPGVLPASREGTWATPFTPGLQVCRWYYPHPPFSLCFTWGHSSEL